MSLPRSTRVLGTLTALLLVVYGIMLATGHHGHGTSGHHHHHHHHEHTAVDYEPVLRAEANQITFIEASNPHDGWVLRLEEGQLSVYEGEVFCDGRSPLEPPVQRRIRQDERLQQQWRTFFSNMTPDAHITPEARAERYGLDDPTGCMRIGVMRTEQREEVVSITFGELTVQGLNQYILASTSEDILLIPRYFWQQVQLQVNN